MLQFKKDDRVQVSQDFPKSKLDIVGLAYGQKGTVKVVMRGRGDDQGIAIVKWDDGRITNSNEAHLEFAK